MPVVILPTQPWLSVAPQEWSIKREQEIAAFSNDTISGHYQPAELDGTVAGGASTAGELVGSLESLSRL